MARDYCLKTGSLLGLHRFTPRQLAVQMAVSGLAQAELAPASSISLEALVFRAVRKCLQEDSLAYFKPVAHLPGFPRALLSTIQELRLEKVGATALEQLGHSGRDLATLLTAYEYELEIESLADMAGILKLAVDQLEYGHSPFSRLPLILLDVSPTSSAEKELFQVLVKDSPSVLALHHAYDQRGTETLEELLGVERSDIPTEAAGSILGRIKTGLFRQDSGGREAQDKSFHFFSAPGEGAECVEIARQVLTLAEQGVPFDEVGVLLRSPELHQPLLSEAFNRAGIPAYFSQGSRRPDPSGRAFLALLDCALEGLSASRFAEYLSLEQVPLQPDRSNGIAGEEKLADDPEAITEGVEERPETELGPAKAPRAPYRWESLLVDAAVIGGIDRWRRRLDGLEAETNLKLESAVEDDGKRNFLLNQLALIRDFKDFALPIIDRLSKLSVSATWVEWLERLKELASRTLRKSRSVLAVLEELESMGHIGETSLAEVRLVLSHRLSLLRTEPLSDRYGCVFVGTIEEASGRCFRVTFVPGLAEGLFPRSALEDPLLLDSDRRSLSSQLVTRARRLDEEKLRLVRAVAAAKEELRVSYSRLDVAQGRGRVPSLFLLELIRAAFGEIPELQKLEEEAKPASHSRLGWSVPDDAQESIDTWEFDLATLSSVFARDAAHTRGAVWSLVDRDSLAAQAILARRDRWRRSWRQADGLVSPPDLVRRKLEANGLKVRSFSPTALQHFSACPYRFYLYTIVGLQVREAPVALEQMDPLTRGSVYHRVQAEFFRNLQEAGLLPILPGNLDDALAFLEETISRVSAEYKERVAPAVPQIWDSEVEELRIDLRGWVREVASKDRGQSLPIHFEFGFGLRREPSRDRASREEPAEVLTGFQLRGAIDLIEQLKGGQLRITDHKTGKYRWKLGRIAGGEVLQPALYSLAAEALLRRVVNSGRLFYCTRKGDYREWRVRLDQSTKTTVQTALDLIDEHVNEGFLPAAPRERACKYCDYRLICGPYEEIRLRFKQKTDLARLEKLRGLP